MSPDLPRRSVAKGAAWAVPALSVAGAAPALAASGVTATATCYDTSNGCGAPYRFHLSGRTANNSNLYAYHGFTAGDVDIPSGTIFSWTDTFYVKTADVDSTQLAIQPKPNTQKDTYGSWAVGSLSKGVSTTLGGVSYTAVSYTVTYTTSRVVPAKGSICSYVSTTPAYLRANNVYPGASISAMTMSSGSVTGSGGAYTTAQISTTDGTRAGGSCL